MDQSRMAETRHEARGSAREPDGGMRDVFVRNLFIPFGQVNAGRVPHLVAVSKLYLSKQLLNESILVYIPHKRNTTRAPPYDQCF